ncbi:MAG: TonB-dependent receptor [Bacteroidetes bacterium]|nr:TonB-dependent receptor [Bacteroidota bacterium]
MTKYFILFLITILTCHQLKAQKALQLDTTKTLKEVLVTYQADKLTPITFQNISSIDLKTKSTGQEPSFLLSETPSITNYSDAGNSQGYSYFRFRGIDQTRINMTLDGVPLNEPEDQGAYFSNYPDIFNSVSKIQIQRGVGTSKNGVGSYGGSVQIFSPNLYDSTKTTFGLGYGSFNSLRAFGEYNSGVKNRKALYVRASQIYSDGYKYNSSNNSQSVYISSGLFYDKSTWIINLLAGHQQNQLAWLGVSDSLISIDRQTNANKNEKDQFTQCLVKLQNNWRPNNYSSVQSSIYYTFLKGNYDFNLNGFLGLPTTVELYKYAFQSNLIGFFSNYTFSKKQFNWTTGVHGNIYDRQHTGSEKTLGQLYINTGYKNEASVFTKADYTFKWLTFFADIQYRYSSFDYKGTVTLEKMEWHFINPKAGLSINIKQNSVIYYSIGSTGREPTRNDMFGGNDDLLADSLGNAIISIKTPEYVVNHEFGFRNQSSKLNFNLNLYYMDFENEIVLDGKFGPNGLALTNKVEQSFRTGIELNLTYKVNKSFSLINNSSFNYSRIKEQKEVFTPILTPPLIINQEAVYSYKGFSVAVSARYQDKSFIDFANTSTVKSYFLINGRISYDIKCFQLCVFVNNITDSKYFNNGYIDFDGSKKYFVQAPTNFYVSLKYSF